MTRTAKYEAMVKRETAAIADYDREVTRVKAERERLKAKRAANARLVSLARIAAYTRKLKRLQRDRDRLAVALNKHRQILKRLKRPKTERQKQAGACLDHPNTRFVYISSTGGSARRGLEAQEAGKKAYCVWLRVYTNISVNLMRGLRATADKGIVLSNCIINGEHQNRSLVDGHGSGRCEDEDNASQVSTSTSIQTNGRYGGVKNFERDHRHYLFPMTNA